MITCHNRGRTKRPSYDEIAGRVCLVQDFSEWGGVKGPFRFTADDGRVVIGNLLVRSWDEQERRWKYSDESDTGSDVRIDKQAIRASCDTAAEAVAMMEVSRVAMDTFASVRRQVDARLASLAGNDIAGSPDLRLLSFDDHDEWIDAESGKTVLSLPLAEQFR
jgi:hypothetical protein